MMIFLIIPIIVIIDQVVKYYIQNTMFLNESIPIIKDIFHITYIRNKGVAFGMLSSLPDSIRIPFFIGVGAVFIVFIVLYFKSFLKQEFMVKFSFSLIIGGALGNFVDRVRFGEVVDFIEIGINQRYKWPVFNVADSAITTGVVILILYMLKKKRTS